MGKNNKASATVRDASSGATKTTTKTTTTKTKMKKMKTGGGGTTTTASDARSSDDATTTTNATTTSKPSRAVEEDDFDVDALFGNAKKKRKSETRPEGRDGGGGEETRVRVLLPGQKKPKQKRTKPEFVPVEKARRFEDGLPVYKSYGDFTDMRHGQEGAGTDEKGRKLGPNGEPAGDCPFDCWCCF